MPGLLHLLNPFVSISCSIFCANEICEVVKKDIKNNMQMIEKIEWALKNNKFISYFQPLICSNSLKITKLESLIRMIDKDGNVISPFFFLDIAKKAGLYSKITKQVLANSFDFLAKHNIEISINLSPSDIIRDKIREKIFSLLSKYKDKAHLVTFEILEDEIVEFPKEMMQFIEEVKKAGAKIAIDDFGSGQSNFTRIMETDADFIKIDGSLIKNIDADIDKQNVVKTIIYFAKLEKKKVVAEFVEDEKIYKKLADLGVDYYQGYYFYKPLSPEEIEKELKNY